MALALLLSACGKGKDTVRSPEQIAARAQTMLPADARLAGLYAQSCKTCHGVSGSGAPLAGDHAAWEPRYSKGLDVLLGSAVNGINGMPAGGQCFSCTADDYLALIKFMADKN